MQTQAPTPPIAEPRTIPQVSVPSMPAPPGTTLEQLQVQAAALTRQLAGLEVQEEFLDNQRHDDDLSASQRAQIEANHANLQVQIAQSRADLENVRAQIASVQNVPLNRVSPNGIVLMQPPLQPRPAVDPEMVVGLSFALLMAIALPLSIGYARRLWRGKAQPSASRLDEVPPRLERLEQAVDAIAIEVERISEGQRFVTRILAERPEPATASPSRSDAESALAEGRPILALGAGPIEPIRKAERQAVRQANTPH
jgi:small-conductance mechanosensitive channel